MRFGAGPLECISRFNILCMKLHRRIVPQHIDISLNDIQCVMHPSPFYVQLQNHVKKIYIMKGSLVWKSDERKHCHHTVMRSSTLHLGHCGTL